MLKHSEFINIHMSVIVLSEYISFYDLSKYSGIRNLVQILEDKVMLYNKEDRELFRRVVK